MNGKINFILKKYFQKDELIEDEDKEFQKKSFDYIEQLLKQGLSEFWIIKGLAGLDSEEAWNLRKQILKRQGIIDIGMITSLTGLDSKKAWKMRERYLGQGFDIEYLASNLAGIDSERAWKMRKKLLEPGIINTKGAWSMRKEPLQGIQQNVEIVAGHLIIREQGIDKGFIAESLAGLDSERAWELRDQLLQQLPIKSSVAEVGDKGSVALSITGLDSERAWKLREQLLEQGVHKEDIALSMAGLDSERAWAFREQLLKEGLDKSWIAAGLTGLNSERAWKIRKQLLEEGMGINKKGWIATGVYGNYLMAAVRKVRKDKELKEQVKIY